MNKKTSWGGVADWYDETVNDADSYQKNVIMPNLIRIVDPKKGMTIVDVACGQGYFAQAFAQNGATVIGSDISKELIDIAKKHSSDASFHVAPADKLTFIENGTAENGADVVTIVLALQNIENLSGAVSEAARILKSGDSQSAGRLVIVLNHPAFRIPKRSDWGWDDKTASQYRRVDSYMSDSSEKIDMNPGEKKTDNKEFTMSFHRPLQSYFKAFNKSGLAVTRLEEWISHKKSQKGPRANEEDRMRKEIPMFVCIEAKKIS